jgi:hypothetical protein
VLDEVANQGQVFHLWAVYTFKMTAYRTPGDATSKQLDHLAALSIRVAFPATEASWLSLLTIFSDLPGV